MTDTASLIPAPDFDLERFTPYRLSVAAKRTSEKLARLYRTRFGISIAEWRVLAHLSQLDQTGAPPAPTPQARTDQTHQTAPGPGLSVRDIETRVALERYEISRTAKRLEEAGLIAKHTHPRDRRLVSLSLTDQGRALMAELLPVALAYQQEIEVRLGAAFDGLDTALDQLIPPKPPT